MPYVLWNPFGYALSLVTSVLTMPGKRTPAVDAAGEERKEREEEKGFNYQEPGSRSAVC